MSEYKIHRRIHKNGRKTRYFVKKGQKFLTSQDICGESFEWLTWEELKDQSFNEVKLFRSERKAIKTAEAQDRWLFRKNKEAGLDTWNKTPK